MTPRPDEQRVLKSLRAIARHIRRTPSRREFIRRSRIPESTVLRFFPSWNAAIRAAGLRPHTRHQRVDDRELLEDWGRAVRKNRKIPSRTTYLQLATFDPRTVARRFQRWSQIPEAFRRFAEGKQEWADVLDLVQAPAPKDPPAGARERKALLAGKTESGSRAAALHTAETAKIRHLRLPGRPIYGRPMDFRGLRHEPVNEQGVLLLFGMVAKELGYIVEAVQSGFPDCEAKRQIAPERWQSVHLEFEFESRNFRGHGHPLTGCDVIVCWRHNWPDCPAHLEILELSSLIHSLPHNKL
jgi:hypothetical protein